MPGQNFAEASMFDAQGECFETVLVDCDTRPAKPVTGDGPVLTAGDDLEWLLKSVSPRLAPGVRHWIRLEADGTCIGGVVWGAPAGEAQRLSPQSHELTA